MRLILGRRSPITSGILEVPGVHRTVLIHRDEYGIPHIEAEGDDDAWYGVGFCQGQDRAFSLELLLRLARGTLSELVGAEGLPLDRLSRRIGFARSGRAQLDAIDAEGRRIIDAFSRGVTDGAQIGRRRVAHEFALLRSRPTPYSAADVMAAAKLQFFVMASNWDIELARFHILNEDGPDAVAAVDPLYPEWQAVSRPPGSPAGPAADRLSQDLGLLADAVGTGGGSNNWAVAASRTATGRPILACDPHLPPLLPSHWYLAHVTIPEWAVAGATLVGLPAFPAGHNGVAAWGPTLGLADTTDLFTEAIGRDGTSVRQGEGYVQCEVVREVIRCRKRKPTMEEVLITPRGPIVGPALGEEAAAISLRALWLDPLPIRGLLTAHRARSFEEFRREFEQWPSVSLNMVYADTSGHIGWQLVGQVPKRRKGSGTIPLAGSEPGVGWEETPVAFDEMPYVMDPPQGFLATANNKPTPDGEGPFLGHDWIDGYRHARILQVLESRQDWDLPGTQALQMDTVSVPWAELRDIVLSAPVRSDAARQAIDVLAGWDGGVGVDSAEASVFELFVAEMCRRVAVAGAPRSWRWALGRSSSPVLPYTLLTARRVGQLVRLMRDRPESRSRFDWDQAIDGALALAIESLQQEHGDNSQWAWGDVRPLTLRHPLGERAVLARVFNLGPFPWGGDANTVSQAASSPVAPTGNPLVVASLRMAVDVGNWDDARFSLPGGQSGNPLSPHYADLLDAWRRGEGVPIAWSPEAVTTATRTTLRLEPATPVANS